MTGRMNSILERVLSQEIAHQEIWAEKELQQFGTEVTDRKAIIEEIKQWMKENDVRFNNEFYLQEF